MKEVVLLCRGASRVACPGDKEVWSVYKGWEFNPPRIDKVVLTHPLKDFNVPEIKKAQDKYGFEIIASRPFPELGAREYPLEEIVKTFKNSYLGNSVCFLQAIILYTYLDHIKNGGLKIWYYGVDNKGYTTQMLEKGNIEFWLGISHALGVKTITHKESDVGRWITPAVQALPFVMFGEWGDKSDKIKEVTKGWRY